MFCPACQTVTRLAVISPDTDPVCPTCGVALRPVTERDAVEVVEVNDGKAAPDQRALASLAPRHAAPSALALLPTLAVQAWRQPIVRGAITTGASAVALSLAARIAQRALLDRASRRALAAPLSATATPALRELLRPRRARRGAGRGEVTETLIVVQRAWRP